MTANYRPTVTPPDSVPGWIVFILAYCALGALIYIVRTITNAYATVRDALHR